MWALNSLYQFKHNIVRKYREKSIRIYTIDLPRLETYMTQQKWLNFFSAKIVCTEK